MLDAAIFDDFQFADDVGAVDGVQMGMAAGVVTDFKTHFVQSADLLPGHVFGGVCKIRREFADIKCSAESVFFEQGSYISRMGYGSVVETKYDKSIRDWLLQKLRL